MPELKSAVCFVCSRGGWTFLLPPVLEMWMMLVVAPVHGAYVGTESSPNTEIAAIQACFPEITLDRVREELPGLYYGFIFAVIVSILSSGSIVGYCCCYRRHAARRPSNPLAKQVDSSATSEVKRKLTDIAHLGTQGSTMQSPRILVTRSATGSSGSTAEPKPAPIYPAPAVSFGFDGAPNHREPSYHGYTTRADNFADVNSAAAQNFSSNANVFFEVHDGAQTRQPAIIEVPGEETSADGDPQRKVTNVSELGDEVADLAGIHLGIPQHGPGTAPSLTRTWMPEHKELSFPGFLHCDLGKDYTIEKSKIGQGGGGSVLVGRAVNRELSERAGDQVIVVKKLKAPEKGAEAAFKTSFEQEIAIMWYFRDDINIAKVIGYDDREDRVILMKYYGLGSLEELIYKRATYPKFRGIPFHERVLVQLASDMARGLSLIHAKGIIHADLKPANILMEQRQGRLVALITDFGISRILEQSGLVNNFETARNRGITFPYSAPEVLQRAHATLTLDRNIRPELHKARDVFALAVTIAEMMVERKPWSVGGETPTTICQKVLEGKRPYTVEDIEPRTEYPMRMRLWEIVQRAWLQSPVKRTTSTNLYQELMALLPDISEIAAP